MSPASRQDVQNIIDVARNRIEQRTVAKQDIINLTDSLRQLISLHQQSQQMIKQSEYQRLQLTRRLEAVETRMINLEGELRSLNASMNRLVTQRQQPITMPAPVQVDRSNDPGMVRQFGYQS